MPRVSVAHDYDDRADPQRELVLAVQQLRRNLERRSTQNRTAATQLLALSAHESYGSRTTELN